MPTYYQNFKVQEIRPLPRIEIRSEIYLFVIISVSLTKLSVLSLIKEVLFGYALLFPIQTNVHFTFLRFSIVITVLRHRDSFCLIYK